jgi:four helix bundle protein
VLKTFKELEVWQKAHQLVLQTYRVTEGFPDKEKYGIISQVRRSAAAVPANIAEGFGRRSTKELLQFWQMRMGHWKKRVIFRYWAVI